MDVDLDNENDICVDDGLELVETVEPVRVLWREEEEEEGMVMDDEEDITDQQENESLKCSGELSAIENPSRRKENEIDYSFLFPADDSDSHMIGQAVCGWREDGVDDGEDDNASSRRSMEKQLN